MFQGKCARVSRNRFYIYLVQYSHYDTMGGGGGGGEKGGCYSLKWPIRGGFARKGTLFQVSGMQNDRDFMSFSIRNGCEICHLGILKRLT